MKVISYNINGIRAAIKKGLIQWIKKINADVICFQEIKANLDQFDEKKFISLGYNCYWNSAQKKGYSGVAILCKKKPNKVIYGMNDSQIDSEGRVLKIEYDNLSIYSVYFPSGSSGELRQKFKIRFLKKFMAFIKQSYEPTLISGDYNICHKSIDIHDPIRNKNSSGFLPEERKWISDFIDLGFVDTFREINKSANQYTWWSYRALSRARNKGWRIDYHMLSSILQEKILEASILTDVNHSDHCPIYLEIKI